MMPDRRSVRALLPCRAPMPAARSLSATDRTPEHFVHQFGLSDRAASLPLVHAEVARATSMELRDAVAEEPKGLYPELPRCRSLSLRFVACAVSGQD